MFWAIPRVSTTVADRGGVICYRRLSSGPLIASFASYLRSGKFVLRWNEFTDMREASCHTTLLHVFPKLGIHFWDRCEHQKESMSSDRCSVGECDLSGRPYRSGTSSQTLRAFLLHETIPYIPRPVKSSMPIRRVMFSEGYNLAFFWQRRPHRSQW